MNMMLIVNSGPEKKMLNKKKNKNLIRYELCITNLLRDPCLVLIW